jgi:predicted HTH transcriptional regulator
MDREKIQDLLGTYLLFAEETKSEIESNKLEFKSNWFKLKTDEVYQCARHISAIANSLGGGEGFLVFGFDLGAHKACPTKLADSTISDPTQIYEIVNKRINPPVAFDVFDIMYNGNSLSVIKIQPSTVKPHILPFYKDKNGREFKHVTFIRNGSKTELATKEDFERMYMDRTNIFQDHHLEVSLDYSSIRISLQPQQNEKEKLLYMSLNLHFENLGRRNIALDKIEIEINRDFFKNLNVIPPNKLLLTADFKSYGKDEISRKITPNHLIEEKMSFICHGFMAHGYHIGDFDEINIQLSKMIDILRIENLRVYTSNGKVLVPDIHHKLK